MSKKGYVQRSLTVPLQRSFEFPKPLDEASEIEMERKRCIGRVTTHVLKRLTSEFAESGFEWLLPVIFSQSTDPLWPDQDASIEKRLEFEIYGKIVRPTASMIVHKMVACSLTHPKLFILSPNIRIEKRERESTGTHAYEFTQLDFEARNASSADIRSFVEKVICKLVGSLKEEMSGELLRLGTSRCSAVPPTPFKVYDREELERKYGMGWASELAFEADEPVWVTNLPREFYDFEDLESGKWDNYDLFLPRYGEVLSGARREFEHDKMVAKMEKGDVKKENYGVLLKLAKDGRLKPSAGAGIGLERLVSWIVEAKHVGEVQLFPRIPGRIYEL
jgi:asparaginyl-tRNA synthetase